MKASLKTGLAAARDYPIDAARTVDFMGEEARVYATPMLVRDIEVACRELLLEHLDAGEDSVGTRVEIDHLAPTLQGSRVRVEVTLAELKGRAAVFDVQAFEDREPICRGRHSRFIVKVEQVKDRLKQKQARAA